MKESIFCYKCIKSIFTVSAETGAMIRKSPHKVLCQKCIPNSIKDPFISPWLKQEWDECLKNL